MSILRVAPVLAAAAALLCAGPAAAAPPWSAPLTVAAGIPQLGEPTIGFGTGGRAVLSARLTTEAQGVPSRGFTRLFGQQPGGTFAGRARIVLAAPPAPYGQTRLVLLRTPLTAGNLTVGDLEHPQTSLGYSYGRTGGPLEVEVDAYHRLTTRADPGSAAIAANGRGDVIAVWVEHLGDRDHLVAAVRRAGGAFGRPAVLAGTGHVSSPAVAVAADGDLLVSFQRSISRRGRGPERRVEARVRRAGHSWGAPQRLGASSGFSDIAAAAAPDGRMVVAWGTQDIGEEANSPWLVRAAVRDGGPHVFHSARELESSQGIDRPAGRVAAAIAPDGAATVAWSGIAGQGFPYAYPAQAATAPAGDFRFGGAQTLAPSAAVGDVATDAAGTTYVVWATLPEAGNNQTTDEVYASVRPAGAASFAALEAVGPAERATLPRAAVDPATGRPAVVWISRLQGATQLLRFSARTG
jgi:hypothetical protein